MNFLGLKGNYITLLDTPHFSLLSLTNLNKSQEPTPASPDLSCHLGSGRTGQEDALFLNHQATQDTTATVSTPRQKPLTVHIPTQRPAVGPKQVLHGFQNCLQLLLLPDLRLRHLCHIQLAVCQLFCRDKDTCH